MVVAAAFVAASLLGGAGAERADGACAAVVAYLGVPYLGAGAVPEGDVGAPAGTAVRPVCNDVVLIGVPSPPEPVVAELARRIVGVAPRFAVAVNHGGGPSGPGALMVHAAETRCTGATTAAQLTCLRGRTTRLRTGPALVAPVGARIGETVALGVRLRQRASLRRGTEALLQQRTGAGWMRVARLPVTGAGRRATVTVPAVPAGPYRIAERVRVDGSPLLLTAAVTVLPAAATP